MAATRYQAVTSFKHGRIITKGKGKENVVICMREGEQNQLDEVQAKPLLTAGLVTLVKPEAETD